MQIIGVAGLRGSGKTTLVRVVAEQLVEDSYGLPRLRKFGGDGLERLVAMSAVFEQSQQDEYKMLADGNPRSEIIILIDDVEYAEQVEMIHQAGGTLIFVDAHRRQKDLFASWREESGQQLAKLYAAGLIPEEVFHWHVTNFHTVERFTEDIKAVYHYWIGEQIEGV